MTLEDFLNEYLLFGFSLHETKPQGQPAGFILLLPCLHSVVKGRRGCGVEIKSDTSGLIFAWTVSLLIITEMEKNPKSTIRLQMADEPAGQRLGVTGQSSTACYDSGTLCRCSS